MAMEARTRNSSTLPAAAGTSSFAELLESLNKVHRSEVLAVRKENIQLKCRLGWGSREDRHEVCGTYMDEDGNQVTVSAAGNAVTLSYAAPRDSLEVGLLELFGQTGEYKDGILEWSNGHRWEKSSVSPRQVSPGGDEGLAVFPEDEEETNDDEPRFTPDSISRRPPRSSRHPIPLHDEQSGDQQRISGRASLGDGTSNATDTGVDPNDPHDSRSIPVGAQMPGSSPLSSTATTLRRPATSTNLSESLRSAHRRLTTTQSTVALPFAKKQATMSSPSRRGGQLKKFVTGPWFEGITWTLIVSSACIMALEMQYTGIDIGHKLGYPGSNTVASDAWPSATRVFIIFEFVFGVIFTLELLIKLIALQAKFWCGKDSIWNLLDMVVVALWWVWQADQLAGESTIKLNPQILRIFRLGRLLRLLKMVRRFSTFDSLHVMTTAMKGSANVFVWACVLLTLFQTMMALILTSTIQDTFLEQKHIDMTKRKEVYEYFGTFTRSFLTMFELTLANWPPASRVLTENISEFWTIFAVLHKLTIGFALVGIINGVFMQETFKVASMDDKIMLRQKQAAKNLHAKKMRALFKHLDTSADGKLDLQEFQQIVRDKQVRDWLSAQDLTVNDADSLFDLIAGDDREIDAEELISGVARLKGNVRMLDFMVLTKGILELRSIFREIAGYDTSEEGLESDNSPLHAVMHRATCAQ